MRETGRSRGQRGGQRGGYGRGGYKGDRGDDVAPRRGRGGYRNMGPKNEFDGGDDDED